MTLKEAKLRVIVKYLDLENRWRHYDNLILKFTNEQLPYTYEKNQRDELDNALETLLSYYYMTFNKRLIDDLEHYKRMGVLK